MCFHCLPRRACASPRRPRRSKQNAASGWRPLTSKPRPSAAACRATGMKRPSPPPAQPRTAADTEITRRTTMFSRRGFLGSAAMLASAGAISGRLQAAGIPEAPSTSATTMQPPIVPTSGPDYQPAVTLNGWTLPWRMNGDWKEFHLVAEPVVREFAPGMKVNLWGYNGQAPGPTIEAVEGDKVRIFGTNKLHGHRT